MKILRNIIHLNVWWKTGAFKPVLVTRYTPDSTFVIQMCELLSHGIDRSNLVETSTIVRLCMYGSYFESGLRQANDDLLLSIRKRCSEVFFSLLGRLHARLHLPPAASDAHESGARCRFCRDAGGRRPSPGRHQPNRRCLHGAEHGTAVHCVPARRP